MTTHAPFELERQWCAQIAVMDFLLTPLADACPLNVVFLTNDEEEWDCPTWFLVRIHVPFGRSDETSAAVLGVVMDALGDAAHVFKAPSVTPTPVIVRDDGALYARHDVRLEILGTAEAFAEWVSAMELFENGPKN